MRVPARRPLLPILVAPLLLLACDKDKPPKREADDTASIHDTGPAPDTDPDCDTGYFDNDGECVPAACGTGTWGNLVVDESTVYVDIAAAEGGDGSEAAPFTSIQEGLDAAGDADGGMVAVAAGTYPETLVLDRGHDGVHLAGRCKELVVIDAGVGDESTAGIEVYVNSSEVEVSGVTVSGSQYAGVLVGSGVVMIEDSEIVGNEYSGIVAYQSGLYETSLFVESCMVAENTVAGVIATGSSTTFTLRETIVRDSLADEDGATGFGIWVYGGASLEAEACDVLRNGTAGVLAYESGSMVTLRETTIHDTWPDEASGSGYGIWIATGASLAVEACEFSGNTAVGVNAADAGTTVSLREATIKDTQSSETWGGYGIQISGGASLTAESCEFSGNRGGESSPSTRTPRSRCLKLPSGTPRRTRTKPADTAFRSLAVRAPPWSPASCRGTRCLASWPRNPIRPSAYGRRLSRTPNPTGTEISASASRSATAGACTRSLAKSPGTRGVESSLSVRIPRSP